MFRALLPRCGPHPPGIRSRSAWRASCGGFAAHHPPPVFLRRSSDRLALEERHGEVEHRAFPRLARHPDLPSVRFNDSLGDGQAETGTEHLIARTSAPVKLVEDPRLLLLADAAASIRHAEHNL